MTVSIRPGGTTVAPPTWRNARSWHRVEPVVRRIVLTLLMLAVLLPSAAFAGVRYFCAIDGRVRSACCCPGVSHKHERKPDAQSEIRSTCCCKISTTAPTVMPQVRTDEAARQTVAPPPIDLPAPTFALPVIDRAIATRWIDLQPPEPDRSLYVRHCALLL